jgi:hypothetical protein
VVTEVSDNGSHEAFFVRLTRDTSAKLAIVLYVVHPEEIASSARLSSRRDP